MYLALLDGQSPETTSPVLMTRDPMILEAFAQALERRVRRGTPTSGETANRALELLRNEAGPNSET